LKNIELILSILQKTYPDAGCELNYQTPFQLLIATMLSAQATDKSVNKLTASLFEEYPEIDDFLKMSQKEIEEKIRKIGLYRNKSKNIYHLCRVLKTAFDGEVPSNEEDLMSLPGVGRKTASVVLAEAFKIPAIAVDTHVFRVTRRLGLTSAQTPDKVSNELMKRIDKSWWIKAHHLFIFHGRRMCKARKPMCEVCPVEKECEKIGLAS